MRYRKRSIASSDRSIFELIVTFSNSSQYPPSSKFELTSKPSKISHRSPKESSPNSKSKPSHYSFTLFTIVEGIRFVSSWLVKVQNHLVPRAWIRSNHSNYLGLRFFYFFPPTQKKARGKKGGRTREKRGKWSRYETCAKSRRLWKRGMKKGGPKEKDSWGEGKREDREIGPPSAVSRVSVITVSVFSGVNSCIWP